MNIIFAGTPGFSSVSLRALVEAGYKIPLVITQPDRRAGRGMLMMPSEVKKTAISLGINTYQPISLKSPDVFERIHRENADVMIVVAFGQIVPKSILSVFPLGCINVHASLLPRWRGAAPIQRAIMAGDEQTGVCIMQMDEGLDTGDVILQKNFSLSDNVTLKELHDECANLGASLLIEVLDKMESFPRIKQPEEGEGALYAHKLSKLPKQMT